jgi:glycyl-tRNA synthetase
MTLTIDEMAAFCKRKGIVFSSSEIYGGLAGFYEYGPLGVEIKNNLKQAWWKYHVRDREDIVGIDGTIISHPKVWEASGHVANFEDAMVECTKCKDRHRADVLIEEVLNINAEGIKLEEIDKIIAENHVKCPKCKSDLGKATPFNMMFSTFIGPAQTEEAKAYLRPETAQNIFADFKNVTDNTRLKLPFGIAQVGRSFRNEISPRNFLFRLREFEQMEIEYFVHPEKTNDCPFMDEVKDYSLLVLSAQAQQENKQEELMSIHECLNKGIISSQWHAYWLAKEHNWFVSLGANPENFRIRQHTSDEKSHYATDTWDLEYKFPFGWKELQGIANRTDYDLKQHMKHSGKELSLFDEEAKQKIVPHVVAEPSQGVDRAFLVFLFDAFKDDKERGNIVLHLHPKLAAYNVAVFPLLGNKEELTAKARVVFDSLKDQFTVTYDRSGSIGRRYARQDESGTPYCITLDFESLDDDDVTIRDRDTTAQARVKIVDLQGTIQGLLAGTIQFSELPPAKKA